MVAHQNRPSSSLDINFISSYIQSEMAAGRYPSGFTRSELEEVIGPFCTSPLGLVPKDKVLFRLIQDLSFPRSGDYVSSVNTQIDPNEFPTEWGTFDITSCLIFQLPDGCQAATFDISSVYRITPVRPDQQWVPVVRWDSKFFVDRALPFGLSSSAGVFGSIADMLADIYRESHTFGPLTKWVDDFFAIRFPYQSWTETDFMDFTAVFGVPWSVEKLRPFNSIQRSIGFDWNLDNRSVSLPEEKKDGIVDLVKSWSQLGKLLTLKDPLALHGKLVFAASIFHLIRPFLPSLIHFTRLFHNVRTSLHPT